MCTLAFDEMYDYRNIYHNDIYHYAILFINFVLHYWMQKFTEKKWSWKIVLFVGFFFCVCKAALMYCLFNSMLIEYLKKKKIAYYVVFFLLFSYLKGENFFSPSAAVACYCNCNKNCRASFFLQLTTVPHNASPVKQTQN